MASFAHARFYASKAPLHRTWRPNSSLALCRNQYFLWYSPISRGFSLFSGYQSSCSKALSFVSPFPFPSARVFSFSSSSSPSSTVTPSSLPTSSISPSSVSVLPSNSTSSPSSSSSSTSASTPSSSSQESSTSVSTPSSSPQEKEQYWIPKSPSSEAPSELPKPPFRIRVVNGVKSVVRGTADLILHPSRISPLLSSLRKKIVAELKHYWHGSKLLAADVSTCWRLIKRVFAGHTLTRRERKQLLRTAADMFRLVPFLVIVIVPFAEFALPFILKFAPNLLPTPFQDQSKKEASGQREFKARMQLAEFLQDTIETMAKSSKRQEEASKLLVLLEKVRKGVRVSNEQILAVARLFDDELTLENINRPQLVTMCRFMGLTPFGSDVLLRQQLYRKLRAIREDDEAIERDGIDSLTTSELQAACRERGMRAQSLTASGLRRNLSQWIELSLHHRVPPSLLILSRAMSIQEKRNSAVTLADTLSALESELVDQVLMDSVGVKDKEKKLEIIQRQNKKIEEEQELTGHTPQPISSGTHDKDIPVDVSVLMEVSALDEEKAQLELLKAERADAVRDGLELAQATTAPVHVESPEVVTLVSAESHDEKEERERTTRATAALNKRVDDLITRLQQRINASEAEIAEKLKVLDKDGDGQVSEEELMDIVKNILKIAKTDEEAALVVHRVTSQLRTSPTGKVALSEVRNLLRKPSKEDQSQTDKHEHLSDPE